MAIFSRRSIQRMVDENAAFLDTQQLGRHVRHLNKGGRDFIDVEWEVAVLNVFSKVGRVRHEPNLGGGKSIDLLFSPDANPALSLIADIATVTDEGFEEENPREQFEDEFFRRIDRLKLGCTGKEALSRFESQHSDHEVEVKYSSESDKDFKEEMSDFFVLSAV